MTTMAPPSSSSSAATSRAAKLRQVRSRSPVVRSKDIPRGQTPPPSDGVGGEDGSSGGGGSSPNVSTKKAERRSSSRSSNSDDESRRGKGSPRRDPQDPSSARTAEAEAAAATTAGRQSSSTTFSTTSSTRGRRAAALLAKKATASGHPHGHHHARIPSGGSSVCSSASAGSGTNAGATASASGASASDRNRKRAKAMAGRSSRPGGRSSSRDPPESTTPRHPGSRAGVKVIASSTTYTTSTTIDTVHSTDGACSTVSEAYSTSSQRTAKAGNTTAAAYNAVASSSSSTSSSSQPNPNNNKRASSAPRARGGGGGSSRANASRAANLRRLRAESPLLLRRVNSHGTSTVRGDPQLHHHPPAPAPDPSPTSSSAVARSDPPTASPDADAAPSRRRSQDGGSSSAEAAVTADAGIGTATVASTADDIPATASIPSSELTFSHSDSSASGTSPTPTTEEHLSVERGIRLIQTMNKEQQQEQPSSAAAAANKIVVPPSSRSLRRDGRSSPVVQQVQRRRSGSGGSGGRSGSLTSLPSPPPSPSISGGGGGGRTTITPPSTPGSGAGSAWDRAQKAVEAQMAMMRVNDNDVSGTSLDEEGSVGGDDRDRSVRAAAEPPGSGGGGGEAEVEDDRGRVEHRGAGTDPELERLREAERRAEEESRRTERKLRAAEEEEAAARREAERRRAEAEAEEARQRETERAAEEAQRRAQEEAERRIQELEARAVEMKSQMERQAEILEMQEREMKSKLERQAEVREMQEQRQQRQHQQQQGGQHQWEQWQQQQQQQQQSGFNQQQALLVSMNQPRQSQYHQQQQVPPSPSEAPLQRPVYGPNNLDPRPYGNLLPRDASPALRVSAPTGSDAITGSSSSALVASPEGSAPGGGWKSTPSPVISTSVSPLPSPHQAMSAYRQQQQQPLRVPSPVQQSHYQQPSPHQLQVNTNLVDQTGRPYLQYQLSPPAQNQQQQSPSFQQQPPPPPPPPPTPPPQQQSPHGQYQQQLHPMQHSLSHGSGYHQPHQQDQHIQSSPHGQPVAHMHYRNQTQNTAYEESPRRSSESGNGVGAGQPYVQQYSYSDAHRGNSEAEESAAAATATAAPRQPLDSPSFDRSSVSDFTPSTFGNGSAVTGATGDRSARSPSRQQEQSKRPDQQHLTSMDPPAFGRGGMAALDPPERVASTSSGGVQVQDPGLGLPRDEDDTDDESTLFGDVKVEEKMTGDAKSAPTTSDLAPLVLSPDGLKSDSESFFEDPTFSPESGSVSVESKSVASWWKENYAESQGGDVNMAVEGALSEGRTIDMSLSTSEAASSLNRSTDPRSLMSPQSQAPTLKTVDESALDGSELVGTAFFSKLGDSSAFDGVEKDKTAKNAVSHTSPTTNVSSKSKGLPAGSASVASASYAGSLAQKLSAQYDIQDDDSVFSGIEEDIVTDSAEVKQRGDKSGPSDAFPNDDVFSGVTDTDPNTPGLVHAGGDMDQKALIDDTTSFMETHIKSPVSGQGSAIAGLKATPNAEANKSGGGVGKGPPESSFALADSVSNINSQCTDKKSVPMDSSNSSRNTDNESPAHVETVRHTDGAPPSGDLGVENRFVPVIVKESGPNDVVGVGDKKDMEIDTRAMDGMSTTSDITSSIVGDPIKRGTLALDHLKHEAAKSSPIAEETNESRESVNSRGEIKEEEASKRGKDQGSVGATNYTDEFDEEDDDFDPEASLERFDKAKSARSKKRSKRRKKTRKPFDDDYYDDETYDDDFTKGGTSTIAGDDYTEYTSETYRSNRSNRSTFFSQYGCALLDAFSAGCAGQSGRSPMRKSSRGRDRDPDYGDPDGDYVDYDDDNDERSRGSQGADGELSDGSGAGNASLSEKEQRVWEDWDKKDTETSTALESPSNSKSGSGSAGSATRLEELEEKQRQAQHLERRARAHEKLLLHAYSALSLPPPPAGVEKGEEISAPSPSSSNAENREPQESGPEQKSLVSVDGNGNVPTPKPFPSKEATPSPQQKSRKQENDGTKSLNLQRQTLEKFCIKLRNEGMEVMKMNRDKKWQDRVLTVSKEMTWLNGEKEGALAGEQGNCPQGLLWAKKFHSKKHSVASIDRHGKGGVMLYDLRGAVLGNVAEYPLSKKQLQGEYKDSVVVVLHSEHEGAPRDIVIRCKSKEAASFLCSGVCSVAEVLQRDAEAKKLAARKVGEAQNRSAVALLQKSPQPLSSKSGTTNGYGDGSLHEC